MPSLKRILFDAKNLARREQFHQAIRLYRKCLDVDPRNEEALIGLGGCYYSLGDSHRARQVWLACLNLYPDSERTKHLLEKTPPNVGEDSLDLDSILRTPLDDDLAEIGIPQHREGASFRRRLTAIPVVLALGVLITVPFAIRSWMGRGGEPHDGSSVPSGSGRGSPSEIDVPVSMTYEGRAVNYVGINLEGVVGADSTGVEPLWRMASEVCGEWGHVRVRLPDRENMARDILETTIRARAHRLIPVFVGPGPFPEDRTGDPTDFVPIVKAYRAAILELNRLGVQVPFLECPDRLEESRSFSEYGDWLEMFVNEIKLFAPQTKVIAGGIRVDTPSFLQSVLQYRPKLAGLVDFWGVHSRPATRILESGANGPGSRYYSEFCGILARFGATKPRLILTSFSVEKDPLNARYVPRGDPLVSAWRKNHVFNEWVLTNTSFALASPATCIWPASEWLEPTGDMTKTYDKIRSLPKPKGGDYLLRGAQVVEGRVYDQDSDRGVPGAYVAAFPGPFVATTDSDGKFRIEGLFNSPYRLQVFKDGYVSLSEGKVTTVDPKKTWEAPLSRVGLIQGSFDREEKGTGVAEGWQAFRQDDLVLFNVDDKERRSGSCAQKVDINVGPKTARIWRLGKPLSAVPGTAYSAEVWIKTQRVIIGRGQGFIFRLEFTDSLGQPMASVEVPDAAEGETEWHPCAVTAVAPDGVSRVRVSMEIRVSKGVYWIDDVFMHTADAPLPSDVVGEWTKPGDKKITGMVIDTGGKPIKGAAATLRPGGRTAVTDYTGRYSISNLPPGTYSLFVTHPAFIVYRAADLVVGDGGSERHDITLEFSPVPEEFRNPGFEKLGPDPGLIVGWNRWGLIDGILEYARTTPPVQPHRGLGALGLKAAPIPRSGGVFQSTAVEPGESYEASCWVRISAPDNRRDWAKARVGIDPFGGTDPQSADVVWGEWRDEPGDWRRAKVVTQAERPRATTFVELIQMSVDSEILVDTAQVRKVPVLGPQ